jgi:hypothetical protein
MSVPLRPTEKYPNKINMLIQNNGTLPNLEVFGYVRANTSPVDEFPHIYPQAYHVRRG